MKLIIRAACSGLFFIFLFSCKKDVVKAPEETMPPPAPVVKVDDDTRDYGPYAALQPVRYIRTQIESVYAGSINNPQYAHLPELEIF